MTSTDTNAPPLANAGASLGAAPATALESVHRGNRLAVATVLAVAVFVTSATLAWIALRDVAGEIERTATERLRFALGVRQERVVGYLENVGRDLEGLASSRLSRTLVEDFADALAADGEDAYADIRRAYVFDNPNPPERRQALLSARDGSAYSEVHARYHEWLSSFAAAHDYYDVFLADADGNVVYSVFKEDDFGTNLVTGDYGETALGRTFARLSRDRTLGRAAFSDFVEYAPSGDRPAAFVGSAIEHDGRFVGALLVQLRQSRFDELIAVEGPGALDVDAYLFGADGLLRAATGVAGSDVLRIPYAGPGAVAALDKRAGVLETNAADGDGALVAHAPLRWSGVSWGLAVELPRADVDRPLEELRRTLVATVLLATLLAFLVGWALAERPEPDALAL